MSSRVLTGCHEVGVDSMSVFICVCMKNRRICIGVGCEYDSIDSILRAGESTACVVRIRKN